LMGPVNAVMRWGTMESLGSGAILGVCAQARSAQTGLLITF